jgi:hypothetical protein
MKRAGFESRLGYRAGIAVVRSAMSSMQALGDAGGASDAPNVAISLCPFDP